MTGQNQSSARFRSATEFPKTIESLSHSQADQLYKEMRDCLIFTNRSRSQLIRRNEEHKQSALQFKADIEQLQSMISQLTLEKEQLVSSNQQIITDLEREIGSMTGYLDQISTAFDSVSDIDYSEKAYWSYLSVPSRFFKFLRAIKEIVLWWREDKGEETQALKVTNISQSYLPGEVDTDEDRREKPQMYTDSASQGRSLLDK